MPVPADVNVSPTKNHNVLRILQVWGQFDRSSECDGTRNARTPRGRGVQYSVIRAVLYASRAPHFEQKSGLSDLPRYLLQAGHLQLKSENTTAAINKPKMANISVSDSKPPIELLGLSRSQNPSNNVKTTGAITAACLFFRVRNSS